MQACRQVLYALLLAGAYLPTALAQPPDPSEPSASPSEAEPRERDSPVRAPSDGVSDEEAPDTVEQSAAATESQPPVGETTHEAESAPAPAPADPGPHATSVTPRTGPTHASLADASSTDASPSDALSEQPGEPSDASEMVGRVLSTENGAPRQFVIWQDGQSFIKPVIQISALGVGYIPHSDVSESLSGRLSTLALARFGFEGELFGFLSFRSVFERNLGYSLSRNGPVGTSVWEGTASLQARENYIRIHRWGLALTGGIFRDPASVDYVSDNILDAFGMDPYVRDPLLVSGFSQGQGAMLRYSTHGLTAGLSFTAGNPLTSSLAFGFGGDVSALGTLFTAPLRALSSGIPGSDIQMYVVSPSLTYEHEVFDIKLATQIYRVDVDLSSDNDLRLSGYNLRGTARVKLLDEQLIFFAGGSYRANEQLAVPDLSTRKDDYSGVLVNGGFDVRFGDFGAGASYYWIRSTLGPTTDFTNHYLNVGATYWLRDPNVSVGLRWARTMTDFDTDPVTVPRLKATDSIILSLRLLI